MFLSSSTSRVYHDMPHLKPACNVKALKDQKRTKEPPPKKRPCLHCIGRPNA